MKRAVLTRSFTVTKGDAKVAVKFERFLSVAQQELSVQRLSVKNVGSSKVDLVIDSAIDGDVKNEDSNYDERFWEILSTEQGTDSGNVLAETTPNPFGTPRFTSGMEMRHVTNLKAEKVAQPNEKEVVNQFTGELAPNESAQLEKRVIVVTSRDYDTKMR